MLRYVQRRGNSTVYEWRTGAEPSVVERPRMEEPPERVEEDAVRQPGESRFPTHLSPSARVQSPRRKKVGFG